MRELPGLHGKIARYVMQGTAYIIGAIHKKSSH